MKVSFAHLCDYAMVASGKLTLVGIFTQIGARSFPAQHGPFYLAFQLEFEPPEMGRKCEVEILLRDTDGGEMAKMEASFVPEGTAKPGEPATSSQVIGFPPIQFPKPGAYDFAFFLNDKYERAIQFSVTKAEASGG